MITGGKLFLRQFQRPANDLDARHFLGSSELFGGKRPIVGIGERIGFRLFVGHGVKTGLSGSVDFTRLLALNSTFIAFILNSKACEMKRDVGKRRIVAKQGLFPEAFSGHLCQQRTRYVKSKPERE